MTKISFIKDFYRHNPKFFLIWFSQMASQITLNMINFVMAAKIYEKTGSTLAVAFLWVFYYMPAILLGPFAGYFTDVINRKKLLILTNLFQTITVLFYLLIGPRIYPIYPIVFLYSLFNQFYFPTEAATLPSVVRKADLPIANSLFMFTAQSALAIGFGIGGILMNQFGVDLPVVISAVFLMTATVIVSFLPDTTPQKMSQNFNEFLFNIKDGYIFIKNNNLVLFPLLILVGFQVTVAILATTIPDIAQKLLQIKVAQAGPDLILPLGLGALIGAILMNKLIKKYRKKRIITLGMLFIAISLFGMAYLVNLIATDLRVIVGAILMTVFGFGVIFIFVPNLTLIQERTPNEYRGRVFGALGFTSTLATMPILLLSATLVDLLGIKMLLTTVSVFFIAVVIFYRHFEILFKLNNIKNKNGY